MTLTTLHLAKQNFKFSVAHFLIFDETRAEMLHGHNYQVRLDILCPAGSQGGEQGYFVDFNVLKKLVKAKLDEWDEHVLLPALHPDMKYKVSADGSNYEIHFRNRFYSLPMNEVIWLDVNNTSVEQLSALLAKYFHLHFQKFNVQRVRVTVEETRGQSASSVYAPNK